MWQTPSRGLERQAARPEIEPRAALRARHQRRGVSVGVSTGPPGRAALRLARQALSTTGPAGHRTRVGAGASLSEVRAPRRRAAGVASRLPAVLRDRTRARESLPRPPHAATRSMWRSCNSPSRGRRNASSPAIAICLRSPPTSHALSSRSSSGCSPSRRGDASPGAAPVDGALRANKFAPTTNRGSFVEPNSFGRCRCQLNAFQSNRIECESIAVTVDSVFVPVVLVIVSCRLRAPR
jgi:hypothetical protein